MMKRARSTPIAPCKARLTRGDIDAGIELGGRYMLVAQRPDGKFSYEVDWTTGRESTEDNAVRQAGAAWGMALLYRETRRSDYRIAIDQVLTRQDGRSGQLGAACLIGLSFLERLAFPEGLSDPAAFRTSLDALCAIAEDARLPNGGFHGKFDVKTGTFSGRADPYSSGEALLLLARSGLELGIRERVAKALAWAEEDYHLFVAKPLAKEPDPDVTKGYYQWSSMTWFAFASAGYTPQKWGKRLVEQALWMVDVHRTLSRARNTGYVYEGIIPAWEWARRTGDRDTARKLACVTHQGLRKLCSWQLGHPLAPAALRSAPERFYGAVQNQASEPALRIDVTQHQLHALMYARQFGIDTAEHLCDAPAPAEAKVQPGPNSTEEASQRSTPRPAKSELSILITGDLDFGESYQVRREVNGEENVLKSRGYASSLEKLSGLLSKSDLVLSNLETTLANGLVSPFAKTKGYIHWSDFRETPRQLLAHNIGAVSLANNHSIDFGDEGLLQTLETLERAGIRAFGAGKNLVDARMPFVYEAHLRSSNGASKHLKIRAFAAFAVSELYLNEFRAYAGPEKPGANPLNVKDLAKEIASLKKVEPDTFTIAILHWCRDYKWRSMSQAAAALELVEAGADLLIGHGAHMLQEIEKVAGRWVCHGLGNFVFNSPGRYEKSKVPPFSLVGRLIFTVGSSSPQYLLYPILTDNRKTGYQTRPVGGAEFEEVIRLLREKTNDLAGFDREINTGKDDFGYFISIPVETPSKRAPVKTSSKIPKPRDEAHSLFELTVTHVYRGPNIHAPKPAVRFEVAVNPDALDFSAIAQGMRRLIRLLPELDMVSVPELSDVNWVKSSTSDQILLAETAAIVTFALMRRVDEWIPPVSSGLLVGKSGFYLICEYRRLLDNVKSATVLAVELLRSVCRPLYDAEKCQQEIADFARKGRWRGEPSSVYFCEEAEYRGIPVDPSPSRPVILGWGCLQKRLRDTMTSNTGFLAVTAARNKMQTANILREAGVPVPEQIGVDNRADAIAAALRIGFPVVVKPSNGGQGKGVSVKLTSEAAVAAAFDEAKEVGRTVVVESYIAGLDYRLLVIDDELVAACQRVPGHVVGNGVDTVGRLLEILNSDPRRNGVLMYQISIDLDARRLLGEQGLTLDSIPSAGQVVTLRSKANVSTGGTSKGVTERVHPDNRFLAIAAARALQLDIAGVDLITADITRSYKETGGAVCEVNNRPGIDLHTSPFEGSQVMVAPYVMDMLFPPPSTGRIPIVAVCDDASGHRLAHRIAHILQIAGHDVGLATHAGVWVGGDRISEANAADFDGAKRVLLHPSVSAAVIEITMESMLSDGLGFDLADAVVITSGFAMQARGNEDVAALIRSSAIALIVDGDVKELLSCAGKTKLYLTDRSAIDLSYENVVRIVQDDGTTVTLEATDRRSIALPSMGNSVEQIALCVAACDAVGIAPGMIEDALRASMDTSQHPLLIRGLSTGFGNALMATPRNGAEVDAICRMAQLWTAPQSPDIVIHMTFEGDPGLRAALDAQLRTGAARELATDPTSNDLPALVFKNSDGRVVIMTDRMEYIRRRLED